MFKRIILPFFMLAAVFVVGCSQGNGPPPSAAGSNDHTPTVAASGPASQYVLHTEPTDAKGVKELRKSAKDGDDLVVVGRVGGSPKPLVDGRAAFTIVDESLTPCSARPGDTCDTPWDYCCESKEDLAAATVMIKFVDATGKTLPQDAKTLLGITPLKTVVVRGRAKRDVDGNLTVVASALYIRP